MAETTADEVAQLRAAYARGCARREWWQLHRDELAAHHPEEFVAVRQGEVVASNRELEELLRQIEALGLDVRSDVEVAFLTTRERRFAL